MLREAGDLAMEAMNLEMQAATGMFSGMPAQPLFALTQRAFDVAQMAGDKRRMSAVANKLGYSRLAHGLGDFDRIEQEFRRGLQLSKEISALEDEETILADLCVLFTAKGEYRQALNAYDASIEVGQGRRLWRYWITRHYHGALMMQMGDLAAAHAEAYPGKRTTAPVWHPSLRGEGSLRPGATLPSDGRTWTGAGGVDPDTGRDPGLWRSALRGPGRPAALATR